MRTHRFQQTSQCPRLLPRGVMLIVFAMTCSVSMHGQVNVLERGYNKLRTGANTAETALTPANVSSGANKFHKQFLMRVDGKIEGFPLYASKVQIVGGTHNVIYVATMHNTVFAFDADNGMQLSARWLGIRSRTRSEPSQAYDGSHRMGNSEHPGDRPQDRNVLRCALGLRERRYWADFPPFRPRHGQPEQ